MFMCFVILKKIKSSKPLLQWLSTIMFKNINIYLITKLKILNSKKNQKLSAKLIDVFAFFILTFYSKIENKIKYKEVGMNICMIVINRLSQLYYKFANCDHSRCGMNMKGYNCGHE